MCGVAHPKPEYSTSCHSAHVPGGWEFERYGGMFRQLALDNNVKCFALIDLPWESA